MDIFGEFAVDEEKATGGVWKDLGKGARVKVSRINSPRYTEALARRALEFPELSSGKDLTEAEWVSHLVEVMADALLLDWEGMKWAGTDFPYSRENAVKALHLRDFRDIISRIASDIENFRLAAVEAAVKN